nr:carbamoyltransferase HypF [Vulcanisaeta distributa]
MTARKIHFIGIVQGVGFRPYVKVLADKYGIKGYVRNMGGGEVEVFIEGDDGAVNEFIHEFMNNRPRAIYIEEYSITEDVPRGFSEFKILESSNNVEAISIIPPDLAICDECLREVLDPGNPRRYRYPFNSCSYCGPRFAVIDSLPYDRHNTSWASFKPCPYCQREYDNPVISGLRRYYYQGVSCGSCGPRLRLLTSDGEVIETRDPIKYVVKLIEEGSIVAIKGVGGYHISALATNDDVVLRLREKKRRPTQPFAVMALDIYVASKLVLINDRARDVLTSPQRPIVLLPKLPDSPVSKYVSPGLDKEGVFLPYTALHYLILMDTRDKFLVMTSGNIHDQPMCTDINCALRKLGKVVDYVLDHDLRIAHRVDDSVVRFTDGELVIIRRSRGYAPMWIKLPTKLRRPVIAFGADLQMAGAVAINDKVILTQYIGDLDYVETLDDLDKELRWFSRTYRIKDPVLVCDANPAYRSTWLCHRWAEELNAEVVSVYHHHAHALSVAADWNETDQFVAVTIDGVGYGVDGMAWGGEVLVVDGASFNRYGHLMYVPMPGGDLASLYPVRMVISYMSRFMGDEDVINYLRRLNLLRGLPNGEIEARVVLRQLGSSIMTSGVGRFLDAVSVLLGLSLRRTYEGEPAITLEAAARGGSLINGFKVSISRANKSLVIDTVSLFEQAMEAMLSGAKVSDIAYTTQYLLGRAFGEVACDAVREVGNRNVYVGGGAAVNDYVIGGLREELRRCNADIKLPRRVPPGDGGIALGQAYYLSHFL